MAAVTFLGERFTLINAVGLCILIAGVVLFNFLKYRKIRAGELAVHSSPVRKAPVMLSPRRPPDGAHLLVRSRSPQPINPTSDDPTIGPKRGAHTCRDGDNDFEYVCLQHEAVLRGSTAPCVTCVQQEQLCLTLCNSDLPGGAGGRVGRRVQHTAAGQAVDSGSAESDIVAEPLCHRGSERGFPAEQQADRFVGTNAPSAGRVVNDALTMRLQCSIGSVYLVLLRLHLGCRHTLQWRHCDIERRRQGTAPRVYVLGPPHLRVSQAYD